MYNYLNPGYQQIESNNSELRNPSILSNSFSNNNYNHSQIHQNSVNQYNKPFDTNMIEMNNSIYNPNYMNHTYLEEIEKNRYIVCINLFERLMNLKFKNSFSILKECCEKLKLTLDFNFNTHSPKTGPILFICILKIQDKNYIGDGKISKQEAKLETSKVAIMELIKNEPLAFNCFSKYLDKEERKSNNSSEVLTNANFSQNLNNTNLINEVRELSIKLYKDVPKWETKQKNNEYYTILQCGPKNKIKVYSKFKKQSRLRAAAKMFQILTEEYANRNSGNQNSVFIQKEIEKKEEFNRNIKEIEEIAENKDYNPLKLDPHFSDPNSNKDYHFFENNLNKDSHFFDQNLNKDSHFPDQNSNKDSFTKYLCLEDIHPKEMENLQSMQNFLEGIEDDQSNLELNACDYEKFNLLLNMLKEFLPHFEIFGINCLIPIGSFVLKCMRKDNTVLDIIAVYEESIDNKQLTKEEILKSMGVIIAKYSKEKNEVDWLCLKNENKPKIELRISLKSDSRFKCRILLRKKKEDIVYSPSIYHHIWISGYINKIEGDDELKTVFRVLRKWRESNNLVNFRSEIIDLIIFNLTNSFDIDKYDINKLFWDFINFINVSSYEELLNRLAFYAVCHKKIIEKISKSTFLEIRKNVDDIMKNKSKFINC